MMFKFVVVYVFETTQSQHSFISKMADNPVRREIVCLLGYNWGDALVIRSCDEQKSRNRTKHKVDISPSHHSLAILSALGDLDVLPVEMLNAVLQISDLHTLSAFTLINRQAKAIADGFMPYRLIKAIAPHILVVFTKTEVASHFTAVQVVDALCSNSCAICGRFGA